MKKSQPEKPAYIDSSRRGFIQRSALVGGAAASSVLAVEAVAETEIQPLENSASKTHAGYQLTDKVKEYYRKARF